MLPVALARAHGTHYGIDQRVGLFKTSMLVIHKAFPVSIRHFALQFASVDVSVAHGFDNDLWTHNISVQAYVIQFFLTVLILGPRNGDIAVRCGRAVCRPKHNIAL